MAFDEDTEAPHHVLVNAEDDALVLADLLTAASDDPVGRRIIHSLPRMAAAVDADLYAAVNLAADLKRLAPIGLSREKSCAIALPPADLEPPPRFDRWYLTAADGDFIR